MKRILLLEDDEVLSDGIALALKREEYDFIQCSTLSFARKILLKQAFDMLILDVNLPDGSGFDLCREYRRLSRIPIILLTARDMELDIVAGLECGADDYITKPFSLMVLRARVNALFRRSLPSDTGVPYELDSFSFHFTTMEFFKNGKPVELSKTEQKLLYLLTQNQNTTLTRQRMMEYIWPDGTEYVEDNALSVTIRRLRDKLEDTPSKPKYIRTVYGLGYVWASQEKGEYL